MARLIEIPEVVTVGVLAEKLSIPSTRLITELMKNGVFATVNEKIDFDTATIIVGELGLDIELTQQKAAVQTIVKKNHASSSDAPQRPPVVAVMGHVDHGKTSLLDYIRTSNTAAKEAGGITQHISAYQVKRGDRMITFLDTPGHEAFAALREHGAGLTDVAIIVIAADDGIKPQSLEAIRFARKAGVKMIIAVNKIDKEGANVALIKQQLAEQNLLVEEWGGDTVLVEVSAKTGKGVDQLLDMVLLVSDVEDLRADVDVEGEGLVIESHMEPGKGPIAEVLVQRGTLELGDFVVAGGTYAKVRVLQATDGNSIKKATPSTPVIIGGFKALPEFGDEFIVVKNEKEARTLSEKNYEHKKSGNDSLGMSSSELIRLMNRKTELQELNVIVKADVQGSLTSVIDSLKTIDTDEVAIRIVGSGVGAVNENDVLKAASSDAIIYGFQVDISTAVKRLASRDKVSIRLYRIIYELLDDAKSELSNLLAPEVIETEVGRLIVRGIFKTTKSEIICGGEVTKGPIALPVIGMIYRGEELIAKDITVTNLKRGSQDVKEVQEKEMCGVSLATDQRVSIAEGDRIEFVRREIKERTL